MSLFRFDGRQYGVVYDGLDGPLLFLNSLSQNLSAASQPGLRLVDGELTLNYAGSTSISGSVAGVRGNTTISSATTISAGFVYGTQGKLTVKGSLTSANFSCGVLGQLDLSAATAISTGRIAAIWGDCGATASAGAITGAAIVDCLLLTNTCAGFTINSVIHAEALATYLIDASNSSYSPFFNNHTPSTLSGSFTVNTSAGVRYIALYTTV